MNNQKVEPSSFGGPEGNVDVDSGRGYGFHNGVKGLKRREPPKRSSSLLNFQKHPEILNPYDPVNNTLSLDNYHSLPPRPASDKYSLLRRSSTLDSHTKPPSLNRPIVNTPSNETKFPQKSLSTVSGSANAEPSSHNPDVLPLRRQDSSGPVLSRSRHSSSSSNPGREDQEALYADTINRHENRRYIPFFPGTGRDIDTGSIPGVDELITKFDGGGSHQRRGRAGRRNRINPEDRKRSRSVDSALPFGLRGDSSYLSEFSRNQGRSTEHVLRPSQLGLQKAVQHQDPAARKALSRSASTVEGKFNPKASAQDSSMPESPPGAVCNGTTSSLVYKRGLRRSATLQLKTKMSEEEKSPRSVKVLTSTPTSPSTSCTTGRQLDAARDVPVTPDLLKGQQELAQQTNEETARQILFNYLKEGSSDNDDTTKKKVNLVFEKIQTLKSRAARNASGDKPPDAEERALQEQKAELERKVTELTKQLEEQTQKRRSLAEACERSEVDMKDLQKELDASRDECTRLREQLSKAEADLHTAVEELFQVKMEREQCQTEIRDLQDQLSEMHDELDGTKSGADEEEKEAMLQEVMQLRLGFQEVLLAKEEQEEVLRRRERELTALKGALKEEVATHDQELDKMKEQHEQELRKLRKSIEEAKQANTAASRERTELEVAREAAETRAERLSQEGERLHRRAQELENEVAKLNRIIDEAKLQESRLSDRVSRLEKEKRQLETSLEEAREQEEETALANRALTARLQELQRSMTKLTQDHKDLSERLREENNQKELLKKTKSQVEEERRLLDRTVEKLQKEMGEIVETSQASTQELQVQINEYKEKNRKELTELQRQLRDKDLEQEKARLALKSLQDEMSHLEGDLRQCKRERDEAVLKGQELEQKVYDLEVELETKSHCKDDRSRQFKLMEDRISQLEQDLEEERVSGDELMDRITRGREQVEQMRNELLQERALRQDLECDKMALERRNKDLKSRVAHLEGSQKSTKEGLVSQLEARILELEERLETEERERANLQHLNRKLERKVKDMMMQVDDTHNSLQDQKDQLNLRLKSLKRQMDEAEEEIDRLEHSKKKLQRDLDEQVEANEQLQGQLKALRSEMRRKSTPATLLNDLDDDDDDDDDDDISTDGEQYYGSASAFK
ncbi:hypothetical protein MATL_G00138530 [Megalops atlanticus]|uniref:Myosin tail domain-containing protein n=1 Tax=Megalops atlanticus TaxID=7932 RepID=A0A9D3PTV5_MEGAT|nr:hypothetical protein MATL_G00138530 [Megalops atlanticus]